MITEELDLDRDLVCSELGFTVGMYGDSSLSFTHSRSLTQAFNKVPRKARLAKFSPPEYWLTKIPFVTFQAFLAPTSNLPDWDSAVEYRTNWVFGGICAFHV